MTGFFGKYLEGNVNGREKVLMETKLNHCRANVSGPRPRLLLISIGLFFGALAGCDTVSTETSVTKTQGTLKKTLDDAITANLFIPFSIPSSLFSPLTAFTFADGYETSVVDRGDFADFPLQKNQVAAADVEIIVTNGIELNAALDKKLISKVDLSVLFKDSHVRKIKLHWINPTIHSVSLMKAYELVAASKKKNLKALYASEDNIVVASAFAADGIELVLTDENGIVIKPDVKIPGIATLATDYKNQLANTGSIKLNSTTLYYGYRPFKVRLSASLETPSGLELKEASMQEARAKLTRAKQKR